ncbi:3-oxoacyl-[acyl-carrier-protein] reductase FabG-like [Colias croceus]|uniref:3-oxoacyl-[acyl-carrier-protein] reductase FabG-like n=1 Tax=Colias crocea TaxID=72248 RepID=UPI001E27EB2E|nr:3-oxoacyl-[acyl-carrier-protein] reductase FabG-like [Colias croceus]
MSFKNKVVLVTGASSGIGAATAVEFTKEGAKVAIVGRNEERLQTVSDHCEKLGSKPLLIIADIANDDEAKRMIQKVIDGYGQLDVLVNNAGLAKYGSILDAKIVEAYDSIMNVNLRAQINITVLATPHLIKTKGNIVNISSVGGTLVPRQASKTPYYISKAALNHFTRCAALELASKGVRVNAVSPGPVKTEFFVNSGVSVSTFKVEDMAKNMPLQRISDPIEVAHLILFLASDKAVGITGSEFLADNGYLLAYLENK